MTLIGRGYTSRRIAKELFIAEGTVAVHVHRILAKLNVSSRAEAIALWNRAWPAFPDSRS